MNIRRFCRDFTDVQTGTVYQAFFNGESLNSLLDPPVSAGLALQDSADGKIYFVLQVDPVIFRRKTIHHASEILYAPASISISRFVEGSKDNFGRATDTGMDTIATGLPAYFHSTRGGSSVHEGQDRPEQTGKIRATIQACGVQCSDRITTDQNEAYLVENVNRSELPGFCLLTLIPDKR